MSNTGAPFRRLLCRSRSRLMLVALAALALYCLQQGPSTTTPEYRPAPPIFAGQHHSGGSSQHRRAVLQRANNTQQQQQQHAVGDPVASPATSPAPSPPSLIPSAVTQAVIKIEDRDVIQSVIEAEIPRKQKLVRGPGVGEVVEEEVEAEVPPPLDDYDVHELETELDRRRKRVREVCEATGLDKQGDPNAWEFFIDHRHHLVWCNIFKAASSTWMYNFNLLAGYKEDYLKRSRKTPLVLARARFPRPSVSQLKEALPSYMSFMIVRDPFERLLSAYRNKIEAFRHKFYRKLAREMIAKYRKSGSPYQGLKGPSFSEFVMHVVDTADKPDEHWAPYYHFCTPCQVNFTVIAQVETLSRDQEYVIRHAGLAEELPLGRRGHREALNKARGAPTGELLERYFHQLSRDQMLALYRIYRIDFDMFGYDADRYFRMLNEPEPGIK